MENRTINYKIIDNLLLPEELQLIQDTMLGGKFSWFYNNFVDYNPEYSTGYDDYQHNFQFVHRLYGDYSPKSEYMYILDPILKKLNPASLVRIKANLSTCSPTRIDHNYHVDRNDVQCITAIFYVNDNDGVTVFEDGSEVASVANRLLIFDSQLQHKGTTCTDQKVRCLINFNYFEKIKNG
jgi:hypothetical protein